MLRKWSYSCKAISKQVVNQKMYFLDGEVAGALKFVFSVYQVLLRPGAGLAG